MRRYPPNPPHGVVLVVVAAIVLIAVIVLSAIRHRRCEGGTFVPVYPDRVECVDVRP